MRAILILRAVLVAVLFVGTAHAGKGAEDIVRRARRAYQDRDYRRAAELFEKAHALDPVPALEVNAAQAWRLAGDLLRAADAYAAALASGELAAADQRLARDKLREIEKLTATLRVDEPRGGKLSIAHAEDVAIPAVVHLMPGSHQLVIEQASGKTVTRRLELRAGEERSVSVLSEPAVQSPVQPTARPAPSVVEKPEPAPVRDGEGLAPLRIAGWVTLALGIAGGGATTYLGVRALQEADRWKESNLTDLDAHDEAVTFKTATNVSLAISIALAAAGILMLVIPIDESSTARLYIGPGNASWTVSF